MRLLTKTLAVCLTGLLPFAAFGQGASAVEQESGASITTPNDCAHPSKLVVETVKAIAGKNRSDQLAYLATHQKGAEAVKSYVSICYSNQAIASNIDFGAIFGSAAKATLHFFVGGSGCIACTVGIFAYCGVIDGARVSENELAKAMKMAQTGDTSTPIAQCISDKCGGVCHWAVSG